MRRLAVISILLILAGLLLLLPSSSLYNLITTGSASGTITQRIVAVSGSDDTSTTESLLGFGLIAVGAVVEFFSLFTDVPTAPVRAEAAASLTSESAMTAPQAPPVTRSKEAELG